jgi:hypothetical protein
VISRHPPVDQPNAGCAHVACPQHWYELEWQLAVLLTHLNLPRKPPWSAMGNQGAQTSKFRFGAEQS